MQLQEEAVPRVLPASSELIPCLHPAWVHILITIATCRASWVCLLLPPTHLTIRASMASTHCTASREPLGHLRLRGQRPTTNRQAWWHSGWKPKTQAASSPGPHDYQSTNWRLCTDWAKACYNHDHKQTQMYNPTQYNSNISSWHLYKPVLRCFTILDDVGIFENWGKL